MSDEIIRLILETQGTNTVQEAARAQAALKTAVLDTATTYDVLERQVGEYALVEEQANVRVKAAHASVQTAVTTTATANGEMGRTVLQASYAFQDFTSVLTGGGGFARALGSVQNNIPIILAGLGVGSGLAGVISVLSVGIAAAVPLLFDFAKGEDAAAKATKEHADEADRLNKILSSSQEQTSADVMSYLKEHAPGTVRQGIQAELTRRARQQGLEGEQEQMRDSGVISEFAEDFVKRVTPQIQAKTNTLFGTLASDPSSRAFTAQLARAAPGNFPAGFAEAMEASGRGEAIGSARAQKDAAAERQGEEEVKKGQDKQQDAIRKRIEERAKLAKDQADKESRLTETLNTEGMRGQQAGEAQRAKDSAEALQANMLGAREAAARAQRAAIDAQPENVLRRQQEQLRSAVTREAMDAAGRMGANPDEIGQVVRQAIQDLPAAGGSIKDAVQIAIFQVWQKIQADMAQQAAEIAGIPAQMQGQRPTLLLRGQQ
jgi:hypothetical protein